MKPERGEAKIFSEPSDKELRIIQDKELRELNEIDPHDAFALLRRDLPQVKPKDLAESTELAKRIEAGRLADGKLTEDAKEARNELILSCMPMNIAIAKKYMTNGIPFEDLVQQGVFGLQKATEQYNYRRGFVFATFAHWCVRTAIGRFVEYEVRQTETFSDFLDNDRNEHEERFIETIPDKNALYGSDLENHVDLSILRDILKPELAKLTPKQKAAFLGRFEENLTYPQIGEKEGHTKQGVKQLIKYGLKRFKTGEISKKLKNFKT